MEKRGKLQNSEKLSTFRDSEMGKHGKKKKYQEKLKKAKKRLKRMEKELSALRAAGTISEEKAVQRDDRLQPEAPLRERIQEISAEALPEARGVLGELRQLLKDFLRDPQEVISRELEKKGHTAAWLVYLLGILPFLVMGLLLSGLIGGLQLGLLYALLSLLYPFVFFLLSRSRRSLRMESVFPCFWTADLGICLAHLLSMLLVLLGLWFLALLLELAALPLQMVFRYMAALSLSEMESREAIRSTVLSAVACMLFLLLLLFMGLGASLLNAALGQLLDGGLDVKSVLGFLLEYL